jgi:hypothetical protein
MRRGWTRLRIALAIGATSGVLMALRLFFPKPIGMADNGDGAGLMCTLNVAPRQQGFSNLYDAHAIFRYYPSHAGCGASNRGSSTTAYFMRANEWLARFLHFGAPIDLRITMVLYCVLVAALVVGLCLATPWGWKGQAAAAAGFLLIAGDSSIAGYPGSPFTETAGIVGLLIMAVAVLWAARTDRGVIPALVGVVVFAGAAALTVKSKPEMATAAVPIVVFLVWLVCRDRQWFASDGIARATSRVVEGVALLSLVAIATITATGIVTLRGNPKQFAWINKDQVLFVGILPHTHAAQALKEMGLPTSMAKYKGDTDFEPDTADRPNWDPIYPEQVEPKESYTLYAKYMLHHPQVGIAVLDVGAQHFLRGQVSSLGSYQAGEGAGGVQEKRVALLTTLMSDLAPTGIYGYVALSGAAAWLAIRFARRRRRGSLGHSAAVGSLLFNAIAATQLLTSALADDPTLVKHYILGVAAGFLAGGLVALAGACVGDRPTTEPPTAPITEELVVPPEEHPSELVGAGSS